MKILQVVHNFPPHSWAGTENYTLALSLALRSLGVEIEVIHPRHKTGSMDVELFDVGGLPVMTADLPQRRSAYERIINKSAANVVVQVARQRRVDLIHAQHLIKFSGEVLPLAEQYGIPTVLTLHDFWLSCHYTFRQKPGMQPCPGHGDETCLECLAEFVDVEGDPGRRDELIKFHELRRDYHRRIVTLPRQVLTVSRYLYETLKADGYGAPNMRPLPAGIMPFPLAEAPPRKDGKLEFVFMGGMTPNKGAHIAARAFASLDGCRLRIYGKPYNKQYLESVLRTVKAHPDKISYEGGYEPGDRGRILAGCDAVVIPSMMESYCLVAREALFAGKPIIASNTGGIPEAIVPGENGLLFEPGDWRGLWDIVNSLAAKPERLRAMAHKVRPPHTIMDDAREYLDIYNSILG